MPCLRQTSATVSPASCSLSVPIIRVSLKRLVRRNFRGAGRLPPPLHKLAPLALAHAAILLPHHFPRQSPFQHRNRRGAQRHPAHDGGRGFQFHAERAPRAPISFSATATPQWCTTRPTTSTTTRSRSAQAGMPGWWRPGCPAREGGCQHHLVAARLAELICAVCRAARWIGSIRVITGMRWAGFSPPFAADGGNASGGSPTYLLATFYLSFGLIPTNGFRHRQF